MFSKNRKKLGHTQQHYFFYPMDDKSKAIVGKADCYYFRWIFPTFLVDVGN